MGKITINELSNSLKDYIKDKQDAIDNSLETNNKTIVGAINELVQNSVQNSNKIEEIKNKLYDLMLDGGYEVDSSMDIDSLLDLLILSGISVSDIKQIDCGEYHTFVLKNNGSLWSCGWNQYGQLGLNNNNTTYKTFTQVTNNINNDVKQVACGGNFTFIIKNDGSLWCCGKNSNGQLGLNDTTQRYTFTQVTTNINNDIKQIACGTEHVYVLKNDGSIWSCGYNGNGQLGLGDTTTRKTFTQVTTNINNDAKQIACGSSHSFILKNDGTLWSCGLNGNGRLGLGDATNRNTFTQVTTNINNDAKQIACGYHHTFILKNDGSAWGCGLNTYGQLGLGDDTQRNTFTKVTTNINNDVKQIACGDNHTFVLKNDGTVWACGYNGAGQLGLNNNTTKSTFTKINANTNVKQIACGYTYTYILKNDGSVWATGYNTYGQLGVNDTSQRAIFVLVNAIGIEF